jgi:hypothetical protein
MIYRKACDVDVIYGRRYLLNLSRPFSLLLGPVLGRCSAAGYANEPAAPFATINKTHHCDSFSFPPRAWPGVIYVVDETGFSESRRTFE